MTPLSIFVGWDSREPVSWQVLAHSILRRASCPVSIVPLVQSQLRAAGLYLRERGPTESTEFSFTRFLVPFLSDYQGLSIFMDCDMICLADIDTLWRGIDPKKAVSVCKHEYVPRSDTKFLGQPQTAYPRKNWSSLMVFNNALCRALTTHAVNTASGMELHRFLWLKDEQIGSIPLEWNYLVGEDGQSKAPPKNLHFTNGGPWFEEYRDCEYADVWLRERDEAMGASCLAVGGRA